MKMRRLHPDLVLTALAAIILTGYVAGTTLTSRHGGSLVKGDARGYFAYLPSLVFDRDIFLNNQFETLRPEGRAAFPYGEGPEGRAANPFPIAPALLWLPGYLAGAAIEVSLPSFRFGQPAGYGAAAVWGAAAAALLFAAIGAILTRRIIVDVIGSRDALVAVAATWLGTAALYYTLVTPLYSHAVSWFSVASMLYLTHHCVSRSSRAEWWFVSGVFGGFMIAIRLLDGALLIVPAYMMATIAISSPHTRRDLIWNVIAWGVGLVMGYLPQGLTSYQLYGQWTPSSPGELGATFQPRVFWDALFSTGFEGWFSWTPIVAFALTGLAVTIFRSQAPPLQRLAIACLLGAVALYLTDVFHPYARPGAAFGARRYVSASPLVAVGIAAWLDNAGQRTRRLLLMLIGVLVAWNLWLLCCYELLVIRHRVYPTLSQTVQFALSLRAP